MSQLDSCPASSLIEAKYASVSLHEFVCDSCHVAAVVTAGQPVDQQHNGDLGLPQVWAIVMQHDLIAVGKSHAMLLSTIGDSPPKVSAGDGLSVSSAKQGVGNEVWN